MTYLIPLAIAGAGALWFLSKKQATPPAPPPTWVHTSPPPVSLPVVSSIPTKIEAVQVVEALKAQPVVSNARDAQAIAFDHFVKAGLGNIVVRRQALQRSDYIKGKWWRFFWTKTEGGKRYDLMMLVRHDGTVHVTDGGWKAVTPVVKAAPAVQAAQPVPYTPAQYATTAPVELANQLWAGIQGVALMLSSGDAEMIAKAKESIAALPNELAKPDMKLALGGRTLEQFVTERLEASSATADEKAKMLFRPCAAQARSPTAPSATTRKKRRTSSPIRWCSSSLRASSA